MKRLTKTLCLSLVVPLLAALAATQANLGGVRLVELADPVYPPLARQARITGVVLVKIRIDQDGTTQAVVLSGHPVLREAALTSAQQSRFDCSTCSSSRTYLMRYVFNESSGGDCCNAFAVPPAVQQAAESKDGEGNGQTEVTIMAQPTCICDPAATITKHRSAKCLYLWKCSRVERELP